MSKAEEFATHWHGSQVRNVEHCREIVEILNTEDMLAAAWLHDVLEDTECGSQTIYREFGFDGHCTNRLSQVYRKSRNA